MGNETGDVFTPETILTSEGVSTEGLRCEFESFDVQVETDYGESPPRRLSDFLETTDGVSVGPMTTALGSLAVDESKRKYRAQTLQPGDRVSVVGRATPRRENAATATRPSDLAVTQTTDSTVYLTEPPADEATDVGGSLLLGGLTGVVGVALLAVRFVI